MTGPHGTDATAYMLIFAAALAMAIGGTPLIRRLALRLDVVDRPSARKLHASPVPLLGGVAIFGAFIAAVLLFGNKYGLRELISILVGASLMSFLGVWDDRRSLSPWLKLLGQFLAASILVFSGVRVGTFRVEWVNIALTLGWVVVITNAMNLLDNMDGLSGGVGAVAAVFFLLLAAMNGQYLVGALSAALVGACLGFLVYNFNPARIFMGDAGALFLGFVLAATAIKLRFPDGLEIVTWMVPVLILGLPLFDTGLVIVSRLEARPEPPDHAGQGPRIAPAGGAGLDAARVGPHLLPGLHRPGGAGAVRDPGQHRRGLCRGWHRAAGGALGGVAAGEGGLSGQGGQGQPAAPAPRDRGRSPWRRRGARRRGKPWIA